MRWIERKEISIKHAKNYTINDTSHQKCIAVHLRIEMEIIMRRRHRFTYWSTREREQESTYRYLWVLARFLPLYFFSRIMYSRAVSFKTHNTHNNKFASEKICSSNDLAAMNVFVGPEINQLITRNLQSNHLHQCKWGWYWFHHPKEKKRVNFLHIPKVLLMKTSLSKGKKKPNSNTFDRECVHFNA